MKLPAETSVVDVRRSSNVTLPVSPKLLTALKALRLSIANEQRVPAFVIFPDTTLIDMCTKLPTTSDELLKVSGVGQVKLQRYGNRFLDVIREHASDSLESSATTTTKTPPTPLPTAIEISYEAVTISVVADRVNSYLLLHGQKKLSAAKINAWLVSQGYLEVLTDTYGKNVRRPTPKGNTLGIVVEKRPYNGVEYDTNYYGKAVQELIAERIADILVYAQQ